MGILKKHRFNKAESIEIVIPYRSNFNIQSGDSLSVEILCVHDWYDDLISLSSHSNKATKYRQIQPNMV